MSPFEEYQKRLAGDPCPVHELLEAAAQRAAASGSWAIRWPRELRGLMQMRQPLAYTSLARAARRELEIHRATEALLCAVPSVFTVEQDRGAAAMVAPLFETSPVCRDPRSR